jgi:hypothetical protein
MFHPLTAFVSLVAAMAKVHIKLPSTKIRSMLPHIFGVLAVCNDASSRYALSRRALSRHALYRPALMPVTPTLKCMKGMQLGGAKRDGEHPSPN